MKYGKGFSLIEVLVTLLLTSIGVLGMVAMQGRSIHYTQDAVQRNTAVALASELIDIIRTNPGELYANTPPLEPVYSGMKSSSMFYKKMGEDFSPVPNSCAKPQEAKTAQEQRDCWIMKAQQVLPGAEKVFKQGSYTCRSSTKSSSDSPNCDNAGSILEIQLAWSVRKGTCADDKAPDETTCIYRVRVEL